MPMKNTKNSIVYPEMQTDQIAPTNYANDMDSTTLTETFP